MKGFGEFGVFGLAVTVAAVDAPGGVDRPRG